MNRRMEDQVAGGRRIWLAFVYGAVAGWCGHVLYVMWFA